MKIIMNNDFVLPNEEWKKSPIGEYYASNLGRVLNGQKNSVCGYNLIEGTMRGGQRQLRLKVNGKSETIYVSKLVAMTFISNPNNYKCVKHIDGNKHNNKASNLEWVTLTDVISIGKNNKKNVITSGVIRY